MSTVYPVFITPPSYSNAAALTAVNVTTPYLRNGSRALIPGVGMFYLEQASTAAPVTNVVIAATPTGNWLLDTTPYIILDTNNLLDASQLPAAVIPTTGSLTAGNVAVYYNTSGTIEDIGLVANTVLTSGIVTPDTSIDLVSFDITVGEAALATGGAVTLYASSGSKQYKVRTLELESGGTNFSGGGGDRLGQVTDGTTVYSVIPAATMQALTNARWGVTALPNAASAANNTSTAAGAALVFKYSGGTTDYTAGSLRISGLLQRIA